MDEFLTFLQFIWMFFFDVFLLGFCRHSLLPLMLVLIGLLLSGRLATDYGVRWLVWHENPTKQFVVGVALGALILKTLFTGYLLETDRLGTTPDAPAPHTLDNLLGTSWPNSNPLSVFFFGIVLSIVLPVGLAGLGFWLMEKVAKLWSRRRAQGVAAPAPPPSPASMPIDRVKPTSPVWLILGLTVAVAAFAGLMAGVAYVAWISDGLQWLGEQAIGSMEWLARGYVDKSAYREAVSNWGGVPDVIALHGVAVVSTAAALLFYGVVVPCRKEWFSPAVAVVFLLDFLIAAYGYLSFYLPAMVALGFLAALFLLVLGGVSRFKVRFPNMDYSKLQPLRDYPLPPATALLDSKQVPWRARDRRRPLVIVCASGGGIRAAMWTAAVLEQLEERFEAAFPDEPLGFPYYIRLLTGASGGMLGASFYAASLLPNDPAQPRVVRRVGGLPRSEIKERLGQDSLSALVYRLVYRDLLGSISPIPLPFDRGRALEARWLESLGPAFDCTLDSLRAGEQAGWRPSLILSPMLIEDGRRLLCSNLDLQPLVENCGNVALKTKDLFSLEALEFARLFPQAVATFALSTAARMSASFPYFSPAATLPTWPRRRVVDAGYFDNYGVTIAAAWLFQYRQWLQENASGVVLIQIRDGLSAAARTRPQGTGLDPSTVLGRGFEGLTSPPEGLLSARTWTASFRNDEQLRILTEFFDESVGDLYFTTATFEYSGGAPLTWYLTEPEKASIRNLARSAGQSQSMNDLLAWWEQAAARW